MRLKLTRQLHHRDLAPHIYESREEAMNWLENHIPRSSARNLTAGEADGKLATTRSRRDPGPVT